MNYLVNSGVSEEIDEHETDPLTGNIIGAAIDVHRALGPGCSNQPMKLVSFMN